MTIMAALALPAAISVERRGRTGGLARPSTLRPERDIDRPWSCFSIAGDSTRNSGDGPRFHSVSLYAHRRITLSDLGEAVRGSGLNISVQADNILNNRNVFQHLRSPARRRSASRLRPIPAARCASCSASIEPAPTRGGLQASRSPVGAALRPAPSAGVPDAALQVPIHAILP